jgi:hypothetical protein
VRTPSPALAVSLVALVVALGGTGYAVTQLPRNSVGTQQLRNNAVTGAKVKARTLDASKFKKGTLLQGPRGAQGAQGAQGVPGAPRTVATFGPVTIRLRCFDRGGGVTGIAPEAISTESGPIVTWPDTTSTGTPLSAGVAYGPPGYIYGPTGTEAGAANMRLGIALPDGRVAVTTGLIGWNSLGAGCWMFLA